MYKLEEPSEKVKFQRKERITFSVFALLCLIALAIRVLLVSLFIIHSKNFYKVLVMTGD